MDFEEILGVNFQIFKIVIIFAALKMAEIYNLLCSMVIEWNVVQQWCENKTKIKKISQKDLSEKIGDFVTEIHEKIKQVSGCNVKFPLLKSNKTDYDDIKRTLKKLKETDNLIKYIRLPNEEKSWKDIFKGGIDEDTYRLHIEAIKEILDCNFDHDVFFKKMTNDKPTQPKENADIFAIIDNNKALEKYTLPELVKLRMQICYDTMKGLTEDHLGTVQQWVEIYENFPDNCRMLTRNGEIIGYWFFMCLNDETFEKEKLGTLSDKEISLKNCDCMLIPDNYKGYFASIAIKQDSSYKSFNLLINSFFEQLEEFAKEGYFISEWCANGFTEKGQSVCNHLKMKSLCEHIDGGNLYYVTSWWNLSLPILTKYPKLIELYKKHFDE